jgi:ABC-2 type transport system permease protein
MNILAYRARYYVGIITYIIYIAIYYYIWRAIYAHSSVIDSFSLSQIVTYASVGWISRSFFFNNLDRDIERKVVDGSLSLDLLKPVDFQGMQYARVLGESLFRLVLFAAPTAVVAFALFPIKPPVSVAAGLAFMLSTLLACLVYTNINFLVGSLAIPLKNIEGIAYAKHNLILFLSGLLIPFDMLPKTLGTILTYLPFAAVSYLPLNIYIGRTTGPEIVQALLLQAFWMIALLLLSRKIWTWLMARIVIQGG